MRSLMRSSRVFASLFALGALFAGCGNGEGPQPLAGVPTAIVPDSGDSQSGEVGQALSRDLVVLVLRGSQPLPGVSVLFQASDSGALETTRAVTDGFGRASVRWTLGHVAGGRSLQARVANTTLSTTFQASARPGAVDTLRVRPDSMELFAGDTSKVAFSARDRYGNEDPTAVAVWSSSNAAVATVTATGVVTAAAAGLADIIVSLNGKSAAVALRVTEPPVERVEVTSPSLGLLVGDALQLAAVARATNGRVLKQLAIWTSEDPSVATVTTAGLLVGVTPGSVSVKASVGGREGAITIRLTPRPLLATSRLALDYLGRIMDQYHTRYPLYDDVSSAGNHFHAWAKLPDAAAPVSCNGSSTESVLSGATAIRCEFNATPGHDFGGFYFQNGVLLPDSTAPTPNFGTYASAGVDLSGASGLSFWARGARGGEVVDFLTGGVGRDAATGKPLANTPYPESTPVVKLTATLTTTYQKYRIDLSGKNLRYILGGFGWVADKARNPSGTAVFYIDSIQYDLSASRLQLRLAEPRLIRSYETRAVQPNPFDSNKADDIDFVLRNTAFLYDNALAILAFLAGGTASDIERAKLVGRELEYAAQHDRYFMDGRLRTAYAAGDSALPPGWAPNGLLGTVPVPGFYSDSSLTFYEVEQEASDVGNEAWAMIALLALYRQTSLPEFLDCARKLGEFIEQFRNDAGGFQGFQGGEDYPENPSLRHRREYASTEHNLDVFAAFTAMYNLTGELKWREGAEHAREFVETMWDTGRACYLAGTRDPNTRNADAGQLPVDVQVWSLLALTPGAAPHPESLDCAERFHRTSSDGFLGYDFNDDRDGIWWEGTAHVTVAAALAGRAAQAASLRQTLAAAQGSPLFGQSGGMVAASHDGVSSGFNFSWYRRTHVGATAWFILAQQAVNPFFAGRPR
ncbi:MAG: Ig-like domain-containing protein [Gemmatimonadaceae bacterium]